jgi:hypothetical protein
MKTLLLILSLLPIALFAQPEEANELWRPFNFLIGEWEGTGDAKWGISTVKAEYKLVLDGSFLQGIVTSNYEKQDKNPEGEVHVNWDIISFDKARAKYVLRQFHNERIVNQYAVDGSAVEGGKIEFVSEAIENFGSGWRAKETFEISSEDEFIGTFSLAPPGKDFQVYVTNHFRRKNSE